ncbi:hypothetical protein DAEQUDRAFT_68195 [Daedalea quercina L-15889]|uniref:Uncharacterized protein n=1 Tax=Daedalea quercina L-15889 TaxID=1314783 RepID=A0A165L7L1_9APHY|nr:hypothetical protein DAEQUDRAFT_68195 [Daedalea quercina L-15889]
MPGPLHGSDPPTNYWTAQGPADYQHAVYQTTTPDSTSQLEMFNLDGDVGTNSDLMNIGIPSRWPTSDATYYASTFLGNDVTSEISLSTQPVPNPELSLPVHSTSYWQTTDNGAQHVDGDMTVTTTTASGAQALRQLVVTNSSKDPVMSLNQGNIVSTSRETSEPSVSRDAGDFIVIIEDSVTSSKSRYHHVKSRKSRYSWKYILQHGSTPFLRSLGGQIKEALRYRSEADLSVIGTSVTTELINTARSVEQNPPSPGSLKSTPECSIMTSLVLEFANGILREPKNAVTSH